MTPPLDIALAVVDHDSGFVTVLNKRSLALGWRIECFSRVPDVVELRSRRINALVVDLAAIASDERDFIESAARDLPEVGIVVCTGRSSVAERVRGLRAGADDWVTKPCHPEEVLARVEAVVRRPRRARERTDAAPLRRGPLEIRSDRYEALIEGRSLGLTRREFEVLQLLAQNPNKVLERDEIYSAVWGYSMAHGDRSVDVFVGKLRRKLEQAWPHWQFIHTHFGVGYRFEFEAARVVGASADDPHPASRQHPIEIAVGV